MTEAEHLDWRLTHLFNRLETLEARVKGYIFARDNIPEHLKEMITNTLSEIEEVHILKQQAENDCLHGWLSD